MSTILRLIHSFRAKAFLTLLATALCSNVTADDLTVSVTGGEIRGQLFDDGSFAFKGIPFAAAPVGDLRWKAPMPVVPWDGVRDTTRYGAPCAQLDVGWNHNSASISSEDCLYINVWSSGPNTAEHKPVMFWIHGGGNTGGSSLGLGGIEPSFDGADLARNGVVVATINYRLAAFGFFAHPELSAESPHMTSGNYALLDQVAALEWVRDNIEKFGGDPENVTIFGQSAGAHNVSLLMITPFAKGLYHKAIAQSGTVMNSGRITPTLEDMETSSVVIAEKLGATGDKQLPYLRNLPASTILATVPRERGVFPLAPEPVIDGYVIPERPTNTYFDGNELPIPLMIGSTARERRLSDEEDVETAIDEFYGPLTDRALDVYHVDNGEPAADGYPPHGDGRALWRTDTAFRCGGVMIAGLHSRHAPTWLYEFSHADRPRGASHSWELQYVFGNLHEASSQAVDEAVSEQTQIYWSNFAKTGDPNDDESPAWPQHSSGQHYLDLASDGPVPRQALRTDACVLFEERIKSLTAYQKRQ